MKTILSVCVHQHAGNFFVLGIEEEGSVVLWSEPTSDATREEAERIGKSFSEELRIPYGCNHPWLLKHNGPDFIPDRRQQEAN